MRKDYMMRLIAGVRESIDKDPDIIKAREEHGSEVINGVWLDAELLCRVVEEEVLGIKRPLSEGEDAA